MSSFEKKLADFNGQVLYKQAAAGMTVEVVDVNLTPVVRVTRAGKATEFALDTLGVFYSDGDDKFYVEATGEELAPGELNDLAIERALFAQE